ncbi:MAG: hypothetical protein ACE5HL_12385 [Terriglobia bacterium]
MGYAILGYLVAVLVLAISLGKDLEQLATWGTFLTGIGTVGFSAAALYAAFQGLKEYKLRSQAEKRQTELEKARWLSQLFERFYEKDTYKEIRQKIDFGRIADILALIRKDGEENPEFSSEEKNLFDLFTDYMNFFEFVAYLKEQLKQLTAKDIEAMFQYYLERIAQVDKSSEIRKYLEREGFGNLSGLLVKYSPSS